MAEDLKILTNKRGQIKGKLTRFQTFIQNPTNLQNITELEIRAERLTSLLAEFDTIQEQIEIQDETTDHSSERDEFETQYYNLCARVKQTIKDNTNAPHVIENASQQSSSSSPTHDHSISVKLPTINLPSFSGKFEEWISFFDTFNALIDSNDSLSEVQKLHYLKASLTGDAAKTLENIDLTSQNYPIAISLLKDQFQNHRLIIHNHVKALFNLPQIHRDSSALLKQLLNSFFTHIRALKSLGQPIEAWDTLLVSIITNKLDLATHREWELSTNPTELPTLKELTDFLQKRCQVLENISQGKTIQPSHPKLHNFKPPQNAPFKPKAHMTVEQKKCRLCNGSHAVFQCDDLLKSAYAQRLHILSKAKICFNCLNQGHKVDQCRSSGCKKCGKKHNTILHVDPQPSGQPNKESASGEPKQKDTKSMGACATSSKDNSEVLLSTALVNIISPQGIQLSCRAFLDSGSQSNFISEAVCQSLQLKKKRSSLVVTGISEGSTNVNSTVNATVKSINSSYTITTEFLVLPKITGYLPTSHIDTSSWPLPTNIRLADPSFSKPGKIDVLLGQEHFFGLLENGTIQIPDLPTLQNTKLGWVVGGKTPIHSSSQITTTCHVTVMERVDQQLQDFWKIEEINPIKPQMSQEEKLCEEHFISHTRRSEEDGRYTVSMPLKNQTNKLGESHQIAQKRFQQVEKRFRRQPQLKEQYVEFMREYEQLGHMEQVCTHDNDATGYYLPHHPVVKETSSTTKLRVVFDASCKTSNNVSLNDILMVGPTIQDDIFSILVRFRAYIYAITADIEKMYRQIWVDPDQRNLLKILWREKQNEELKTFQLNTVTYGTACAPYLAVKTLQQLATDESVNFPDAAEVILKDFYVDDLITGTDNLAEGIKLQGEISEILHRGGFNLRKWNSNHEDLLYLATKINERHPQEITLSNDKATKTLGLWWNAKDDQLQYIYHIDIKAIHENTKRSILSVIAKIFDPLGLVSPVIIRAKIFLQELWKTKLDWDDKLTEDLHQKWLSFRDCIMSLEKLQVPRSTVGTQSGGILELHGFSDASEQAYGGAVYIKHISVDGKSQVRLLCAKSRVAPLKTASLPRLELCGALLLAELISQVQKALRAKIYKTHFWTDSTIVLSWLSSEASRWKTFVANRVAKIHDLSNPQDWKHVRSEDNPADLVSRGARTVDLLHSNLWWHGPEWLENSDSNWPSNSSKLSQEVITEERGKKITATAVLNSNQTYIAEIIKKSSRLQRLERVIAYCQRFIHNCRHRDSKRSGPLTPQELSSSLFKLIEIDQEMHFAEELPSLKTKQPLPRKSKLLSLNPFIDTRGIVRVGGRLDHSNMTFDQKHPVIVAKGSHLTELIARNEHIRNLHVGPQALLAAIRQRFWPLGGRNLARRIVHQCITCFKAKPKPNQQIMGKLPAHRTTPSRPFTNCGVDYCGPVYIKSGRTRASKLVKGYIAVFVCFATKAIHLELASDLTTDSFLGAFRRFVSRRGLCSNIYSDNGTNFVGAYREIQELRKLLQDQDHQNKVKNSTSTDNINWHFIPPNSPHFGGLWEAGVKSVKYHLRRIVGKAHLTYEEMNTTLTMIEACLNSRPLTLLSTSPNDPLPLTPGHFLTGDALSSLPEPDITIVPENRLSRWQRTQHLMQQFWRRWSTEYLYQLQQNHKWTTGDSDIKPGQVVIVKDDNLPPFRWITAIITEVHPGLDGRVRVATLKTSSGLLKRAVHRLCVLPFPSE